MKGKKTGGRQPGSKNKKTLEKERQLEAAKEVVLRELRPMFEAQAEHAKGVHYMVLRHKDGTFTRATDVKQLDAALAAGAQSFDIFTQAPNTQAFTALMDRTFGKPPESVTITNDQPQMVPVFVMPEGTEIAIK